MKWPTISSSVQGHSLHENSNCVNYSFWKVEPTVSRVNIISICPVRVSKANDVFRDVQLIVGLPSAVRESSLHDIFLPRIIRKPANEREREWHTHLGSKSSGTSQSFWKKKNHCHPSFFPFFPHQQSWRQSLLKVSRSMGEVASQPGRVGHGRRNWWGNFSVSVTIQGNATVCLFSSVFRFCTGFRIFLAWFIVDVHQPWLLPHLIQGETKTALRERFYSCVQVQYKLHTLSLFMDYNLFNITDMEKCTSKINQWMAMLPYSIPHGVYCYITPPPSLLLLPTSLMTLLCVCL